MGWTVSGPPPVSEIRLSGAACMLRSCQEIVGYEVIRHFDGC